MSRPTARLVSAAAVFGLCAPSFLLAIGAAPNRALVAPFAKKVALIVQNGSTAGPASGRRTTLTEAEMNSWFAYHGQRVMPAGLTSPSVELLAGSRIKAAATVDLKEVGRRRGSRGGLDPWSYLGGTVPVTIGGKMVAVKGQARFEMEDATVAGLPVPKFLVQELLTVYTSTPEDPDGLHLEDPIDLPLNIRTVEVTAGQATVVQ